MGINRVDFGQSDTLMSYSQQHRHSDLKPVGSRASITNTKDHSVHTWSTEATKLCVHMCILYSYTYTLAAAFTQYSKSLRAAAGPLRAAVFVKHRVTPAPEQQSSPAYPAHPHTHSESASRPLSSCLSLFSSNSFAFCHSLTDSSLKCSTFSSSLSSLLPALAPEFPHWWHARVFDRLPLKT